MRTIIVLTIAIFMGACSQTCTIDEIDREVNRELIQTFKNEQPDLWENIESEFYRRLAALNLFDPQTDSLSAFIKLMAFINIEGFPPQFFVDTTDLKTRSLLSSLNKIGLTQTDETAQRFLYSQTNHIIKECAKHLKNSDKKEVLIAFGTAQPGSSNLSYDLCAREFSETIDKEDLKQPGLYKSLLLFYFSRMMNPAKFKRNEHYP